jgi:hypothetical protein
MSKPAVMAIRETLYAGYYVERGLATLAGTDKSQDYLMHGDWHWHLFMSTLNTPEQRLVLAELMKRLPEENRGILFLRAPQTEREYLTFIPYTDASSLDEVESLIIESEVNDWIDLILGVRFTLDECLALQDGIVDQLRAPLNLAVSIENLIFASKSNYLRCGTVAA